MSPTSSIHFLHHLARLYGIQTAYYDVCHHRQQAPTESLLAILRSLGAPIATRQDIASAWRERRQVLWQQLVEPVIVAWDGRPPVIQVRLPPVAAEATLNCHLKLETGEQQSWEWRGVDLPVVKAAKIEGIQYVVKQLRLPSRLPWGYHRLILEMPGRHEEALIISAPLKAYLPPDGPENRTWGVFIPLYALQTERSWGSGDFSDLEALMTWVATIEGRVIATLPLLATFLGGIPEPSPYLPASRLLWNEFYLDINRVPELQKCPPAQAILESLSFRKEIKALRHSSLVDYHRQMALKRRVLEELCRYFFAESSNYPEALHRFIEAHPVVEDYARFQATCEKQRKSWQLWPQPSQGGALRAGDYNEENRRYHLYVQWLAHQQIGDIAKKARGKGLQLYLDLPLGVHPSGYDVWRQRDAFILDVSAGAPPDTVFTKGQDWEFPPLHPEKIREQGYRYIIACLRHHLQHAGILRVDHVMGLHRLFCIPRGLEASQGVYIRYRAEELYAILALESHRNKAIVVGEDLGTVPPYVKPTMKRHGLHHMYVVHYELAANPRKGLSPISHSSVASLNTHDMPPFAAFWRGLDIEQRHKLGLLDKESAQKERLTRRDIIKVVSTFARRRGWLKGSDVDTSAAVRACLSLLAASQSRLVLVNLEDLWLETQPQNVPGTKGKYPNWRRKACYSFEKFCQMPQVLDTLRNVNKIRKQGGHE